MKTAIRKVLETDGNTPVLVDVGASDSPPALWAEIAPVSIYVGFDPDRRELRRSGDKRFQKHVIVNEAVVTDPTVENARVFLTKSPFCSSTLRPDHSALGDWLFADLFSVQGEASVRATTLPRALENHGIAGIDWLKIDSQGTDLRIFDSLPVKLSSGVLALDVEPGFIDAYEEEDLFVDTHRALVAKNFWLSRMDVRGTVRIRQSTLDQLEAAERATIGTGVRSSPGWCESRYLRTLPSLVGMGSRAYELLWVFALLDRQPGFALDVALEYETRFGMNERTAILKNVPLHILRRSVLPGACRRIWNGIARRLTKWS